MLSLARLSLPLAACLLLAGGTIQRATADAPERTYVVVFQVGDEAPRQFSYGAGSGNQHGAAPLETKWYLARAKSDHVSHDGSQMKMMSVNGIDLWTLGNDR
jgi:hypothetical protein